MRQIESEKVLKPPWPALRNKLRINVSSFTRPRSNCPLSATRLRLRKKELEKKEEAVTQAEQFDYDIGVKETKDALKAQVTGLC